MVSFSLIRDNHLINLHEVLFIRKVVCSFVEIAYIHNVVISAVYLMMLRYYQLKNSNAILSFSKTS